VTFANRTSQPIDLSGFTAVAGAALGSNKGSITFTAMTAAWTSLDIPATIFSELAVDLTKTTVTTNVQFVVKRKGADGVYYAIATSAIQTAAGADSLSVGSGMANVADTVAATTVWSAGASLGDTVQIVVTPSGAFTGTLSVKGK